MSGFVFFFYFTVCICVVLRTSDSISGPRWGFCIVLYSFIVQVDRTQLILHTSSFAYMVYL